MEGYNESLIKEIKNNKEEYFHESGKYDTIQMICVKSGIYLGIRRENMKKIRKIGSVAIVLVMMLTLLCGCESMQKKKAMMNYQQSLLSDSDIWDSINEGSAKLNSASDLLTMKSVIQANYIPNLKTLSANAQTRNDGITDSEIKALDQHYINVLNLMTEGCTLLLDGVNNEDYSKVNLGNLKLQESQNEFKKYFEDIQSYYNKYGINDGGELEEIQKLFQ